MKNKLMTMVILTSFAIVPIGCGNEKENQTLEFNRAKEEKLSDQLERERRARAKERVISNMQIEEVEYDLETVIGIWLTTAVALVAVILLLSKERRIHTVFQRLFEMTIRRKELP